MSHKITKGSWTASRERQGTDLGGENVEQGGREYDMAAHERMFIPGEHGRFLRNGMWFFRRPDGVVVDAFEGPAQFTKTGQLVPG